MIPSAESIRNPTTEDEAELGKWRDYTRKVIAAFIRDSVDALNNGRVIRFEYPTLRDGGRFLRLWNTHYVEFIDELRDKGYSCDGPSNNRRVVLEIALPN